MITPNPLRAKMVAGTALVLLFGSGIVVGLAWDQTVSAGTPEEIRRGEGPEGREGRRRMIVDNVGLSAIQESEVDSLVVFHRQRMSDLDTEFQPRYWALIGDLREEIKQVLTDDQRVRYDVLLADHDARRAKRRRNNRDKVSIMIPKSILPLGAAMGLGHCFLARTQLAVILGRNP